MEILALLLAAAAYGLFYAASPGRQTAAPPSAGWLKGASGGLAAAAVGCAAFAFGPDVGPVVVLTVMMTAASVLTIAVPLIQRSQNR